MANRHLGGEAGGQGMASRGEPRPAGIGEAGVLEGEERAGDPEGCPEGGPGQRVVGPGGGIVAGVVEGQEHRHEGQVGQVREAVVEGGGGGHGETMAPY